MTDANAVLGHLPSLLGGRMELRRDLAVRAVERVAAPLGLSVEDAALAIVGVVNDRMLGGLRLVSVQRGHDPRTFTLVAFGGAGPLHANALLDLLASPLCVIPPAPGIFSTFGFLAADVQREFSRSRVRRLSMLTRPELVGIVDELAGQAQAWLEAEGFQPGERRLAWQFGMRYFRQGYELPVTHDDPAADRELLETLAVRFAESHQRFYQFDLEVEPELVVVRCVATGVKPRPEVRAHADATAPVDDAATDRGHRIYWRGEWVQASIYARERLRPGHELHGPAVVEQEDSTTLIHPGYRARVDRWLNLILERA